MAIRVEATQSEHEILRIENDCGRATRQSQQSADNRPLAMCEAAEVLRLSRENSEAVNLFIETVQTTVVTIRGGLDKF